VTLHAQPAVNEYTAVDGRVKNLLTYPHHRRRSLFGNRRQLFVPNGQELLLVLPLLWLRIDFSSISYWTLVYKRRWMQISPCHS